MNCGNCKHWFCNPRIEVSDDVIVGRCMVSDVFTLDNNVCNAWELSQVAERVDETKPYLSRIEELKKFINQLIEAGDAVINAYPDWIREEDDWDALVENWKKAQE